MAIDGVEVLKHYMWGYFNKNRLFLKGVLNHVPALKLALCSFFLEGYS